ncbi:hypothetical protein V7195_23640, partial [Priestia megaterium]
GFISKQGVLTMINEQETLLFIKELGRLLKDYQNCSNASVKSEIYKDIVLLSNVIQLDHVNVSYA